MQRSTFADNFLKEIVCKSCGYLKFKRDKITKTVASSDLPLFAWEESAIFWLKVTWLKNILSQILISTGICFAWISHRSGSKSVVTPRIRGH